MDRSTLHTPRRLAFEPLEDRRMLAVFTVINLDDAGPDTLRDAVSEANNLPGADLIQFAPGLSGEINLSVVGDLAAGPTALLITSEISIQGNTAGITIRRDPAAPEMRLFRVASTGSLSLEMLSLTGGILRAPDDTVGRGGAVYNEGTLDISDATLYDNRVIGGNAGSGTLGQPGQGGAIFNDDGTVMLVNTTLSGNVVESGTGPVVVASHGGGVYTLNGNLSIYNSTITNSTATTGRGVYVINDGGVVNVEIYSSIIAQADAPALHRDLVVISQPGDETTVIGAANLIRTQTGIDEPIQWDVDPMLGPLLNNGGPTRTHAFAGASPAIDVGANPRDLTSDQRGPSYARVIGAQADIGAFELQTVIGPALPGDYNVNNIVDAADYILWRKTFGASVSMFAGADGSGNGLIDSPDYDVWQGNFGATNPGAAAAAESVSTPRSSAFDSLASSQPLRANRFSDRSTAAHTRRQTTPFPAQHLHDKALLALFAERRNEFADPESENRTPTRKSDTSPRRTDSPFDEWDCDPAHSAELPLASRPRAHSPAKV